MTPRRWRTRPASARLLAALCLVMLAVTGCRQFGNVETIRFGREFSPDGERLLVASLQPRCGCLSIANASPTKQPIWLESWYYGIPRGGEVLQAGERRRILFDWAGPGPSDFYELVAFRVANENNVQVKDEGAQGGLRIEDMVVEYSPLALMDCSDTTCQFGALSMNRVFSTLNVQGQDSTLTPQPGVNFSSVLEVATPLEDRCGCMLLENADSDHAVTLRATLHGSITGQMTLEPRQTVRVPFDWAGDLDSDVYVIDAVAVEARSDKLGARTAGVTQQPPDGQIPRGAGGLVAPPAMAGMTIRLRDYITIQGHLLDMSCTPEYVVFPVRPPQASSVPSFPQPPLPDTQVSDEIRCSWLPNGSQSLGMYSAFDPTRTIVPAAAGLAPLLTPSPGAGTQQAPPQRSAMPLAPTQ